MAEQPIDLAPSLAPSDQFVHDLPATLDRIWLALCAGRPPGEIARRFFVAASLAGLLWLSVSIFLVLEPGR